jgi:hypothetical protein
MALAKQIKKLTHKRVVLPVNTKLLREAGEIGAEEEASVMIRKVNQGEVTVLVGSMPGIFPLREKLLAEGLRGAELAAAMTTAITTDPQMQMESVRMDWNTKRAVIALGVTSENVTYEQAELTGEGESMIAEDFGEDLEYLYEQIVRFSSLPYLGGNETKAFLAKRDDSPKPDGELLQQATQSTAQTSDGGL